MIIAALLAPLRVAQACGSVLSVHRDVPLIKLTEVVDKFARERLRRANFFHRDLCRHIAHQCACTELNTPSSPGIPFALVIVSVPAATTFLLHTSAVHLEFL